MMSANISMIEVDDLLEAGATAFLSKPINLETLDGYINAIVKC